MATLVLERQRTNKRNLSFRKNKRVLHSCVILIQRVFLEKADVKMVKVMKDIQSLTNT